jgi:hypothetical protein
MALMYVSDEARLSDAGGGQMVPTLIAVHRCGPVS